jgi:hypothetical protein
MTCLNGRNRINHWGIAVPGEVRRRRIFVLLTVAAPDR